MKQYFALVDERLSTRCEESLKSFGFSTVRLPKIPTLPAPIASHTDIISFKLKDSLFFSKAYFEANFDILSPLFANSSILTKESQGVNYPLDAIFNGLLIGNKLFCKKDTFSKEIIRYAERLGIKTVNVKQGYPACTTLKISEKWPRHI